MSTNVRSYLYKQAPLYIPSGSICPICRRMSTSVSLWSGKASKLVKKWLVVEWLSPYVAIQLFTNSSLVTWSSAGV